MPRGWDPAYDPFGGYKETKSFLGITREKDITDSMIDKELDRGKNPRSVFSKRMRGMSVAEKQKVMRRIQAREVKKGQGKK